MIRRSIVVDATYETWVGMSDSEICNKFRAGDIDALEYMYRTYAKDLYSYGMKINANSSLVEDTIQELFLELWNSRKNITNIRKIKFYLLKSLKWKMEYQLKREKKLYGNQPFENLDVEVMLPHEHRFMNDQLLHEKKVMLRKEINKLPQRQREVLDLLFFENMPYEEIAELMHIRVRSVYVLAGRALTQLRKDLKQYESQLLLLGGLFVLALLRILFF